MPRRTKKDNQPTQEHADRHLYITPERRPVAVNHSPARKPRPAEHHFPYPVRPFPNLDPEDSEMTNCSTQPFP